MMTHTKSTSLTLSLVVLTLSTWCVLIVVSGFEQIADPFLRNDDFPAYLLRGDWYYPKTLEEGRWITYLWHLRPFHTAAWINYEVFLLGNALFAAALSLHALGTERRWLTALAAAIVAVSPQAILLSGWFNSLIPSIWISATYAVLALFLSPAAGRNLLFVFIPLTLLSYSPYPLLLLLVCLVRADNRHSAKDYLMLMATFAVAFAFGMAIMFGINWAIHGVFGLHYSGWRSANVARDVSDLVANIPVLLDSYNWMLTGLGFGNRWLGILNVAAFFGALFVIARRNPLEAWYLLTGVLTGLALLSLLALKDGVFIFFRSTQFIWLTYGIVIARAYLVVIETASPRASTVVAGMASLLVISGILANQTYASLVPFQAETRRIAAAIPADTREIRIHGNYADVPEVIEAQVQDESGLRLRLQSLSDVPTVYCETTPERCNGSEPASGGNASGTSIRIETLGGIAVVRLPRSKLNMAAAE